LTFRKVIVIGLDGLEPKIVRQLLEARELPHLASLASQGGFSRISTTHPAQTPVAWSSFATGTNPGGHGVFDFIRRDPELLLPEIALSRHVQRSPFLPPKAENLRRGIPLWQLLSNSGITSTVIRCPCTYPPDQVKGRVLAGLGVPDVRGGFGTPTFYTSANSVEQHESETVVQVELDVSGTASTVLFGPRNTKDGSDSRLSLQLEINRASRSLILRSDGKPNVLELKQASWSDWLRVKFKMGRLQSVAGMVRFFLVRLEPDLELYASPVNFDPKTPMFPISSPWDYAGELSRALGTFYTTGMVEDHTGLNNGRIDEAAFLDQCDQVLVERERMMAYELDRMKEGFFFCLFDTPDRVQHMFWRFREPHHPANRGAPVAEWRYVIEDHYRRCDMIVGRALEYADDRTLVIAMSDHGFASFQRAVNLNTWLHDNGFLALRDGLAPGVEVGDLLQGVDWDRTRAYAVGFGGIYLNLTGRERHGIVPDTVAADVAAEIADRLSDLRDTDRGEMPIRSVLRREDVYAGAFAEESPDLLINFADGYRVSSQTALGAAPAGVVVDNKHRWSGDHAVDPTLVPGVLFMNRPFKNDNVRMVDMAPTILNALGVDKGSAMEGRSVVR
jgi:predicted AlkP superfamily phosphohydrolase/phosphomutase